MTEEFLKYIDNSIYNFLEKNVDIMPKRFIKAIAYYYTDARIRKLYWNKLGVIMGENTYANLGMMVVFKERISIEIGKNVSIAPYVTFVAESSANNGKEINQNRYVKEILTKESVIIVEDEVWIGANVTILPGIRIGKGAVIGAGSVVTKDVESYCIYAGVPARKIRCIKED
jgi:maltose O-acetyltransferase